MLTNMLFAAYVANISRIAGGGDPFDDPYHAAIYAAEISGLNDVMTGAHQGDPHGSIWLIATGITGSRLARQHDEDRWTYPGNAIHRNDARWGRSNYRIAVSRGYLNPVDCQWHRDMGGWSGSAPRYSKWSTRGPYEAMVHDKVRFLPITCFSVEIMDIPAVNALAVAEAAENTCMRHSRRSRRRPCDWRFLRCVWAGIGTCMNNPKFKKSVERRFDRRIRQARALMMRMGDIEPRRRHMRRGDKLVEMLHERVRM